MDLSSLVSVWELNEASGNAVDAHGSNTLTETSGTIDAAAGKISGCRDFEAGDTEYFTVADNAGLSAGDVDFTLTAWVNAESLGAVNRDIIAKWGSNNAVREYIFGYTATDRFRFTVRDTGNATNTTVEANNLGAPSTGTWYFIVAWHDSVANTLNIQVNNGTVDSTSYSGGIQDSTAGFAIGARVDGPQAYWDGLIDQCSLWKRVLTSGERTSLWNGGAGRAYPFASNARAGIIGGGMGRILGV